MVDKELGSTYIIGWNHTEFEVPYHCLADEIKIGEILLPSIYIYIYIYTLITQSGARCSSMVFTICMKPYNRKQNVLSASLNKTFPFLS